MLLHVYLKQGGSSEIGRSGRQTEALSEGDRKVALVTELSELPLDPLTFASMRVVLRHLPCLESNRSKIVQPTITSVANEVNEAAELLYGSYLGPGEPSHVSFSSLSDWSPDLEITIT